MFQSSMHPSSHSFIHPINSHFQPKLVLRHHSKRPWSPGPPRSIVFVAQWHQNRHPRRPQREQRPPWRHRTPRGHRGQRLRSPLSRCRPRMLRVHSNRRRKQEQDSAVSARVNQSSSLLPDASPATQYTIVYFNAKKLWMAAAFKPLMAWIKTRNLTSTMPAGS